MPMVEEIVDAIMLLLFVLLSFWSNNYFFCN